MPKLPTPVLEPYGDYALYLAYPADGYQREINAAVLHLAKTLRANGEWEDVISGYDSLVASFNPVKTTLGAARTALSDAEQALHKSEWRSKKSGAQTPARQIDIPVYYGGDNGPDMDVIKAVSGLTEAEIIALHSGEIYDVCMMGFVPGFTFLSAAPSPLHHPRRAQPRLKVPAGSVGIAGWQTGIYSLASPGGWQIIGRTPLDIFDPARETPFLLQAGDKLRFVPKEGKFPNLQASS